MEDTQVYTPPRTENGHTDTRTTRAVHARQVEQNHTITARRRTTDDVIPATHVRVGVQGEIPFYRLRQLYA